MIKSISPGFLSGQIEAPPSKSYSHRLLVAAALSGQPHEIGPLTFSGDVLATLDCLDALGFIFERKVDSVRFLGGYAGHPDVFEDVLLPCRESGTTLRLMIPLALSMGGSFFFQCTPRLCYRGIQGYAPLFRDQDIRCQSFGHGFLIEGKLRGGSLTVDVSESSQYLSGLLFSLPLLSYDSLIHLEGELESRAYVEMTLDVLRIFGVQVDRTTPRCFFIKAPQRYSLADKSVSVEADYTNAAYLEAFNCIGSSVSVLGLRKDSLQGDSSYRTIFKQLKAGFTVIDISEHIDLGPVLFVLSANLHGAEFHGIRRLRFKESDRVEDLLSELSKFGVRYFVSGDSLVIHPSHLHPPLDIVHGHNDHRVIMALCLMMSVYGGMISDSHAVEKSFPDYFSCLSRLGLKVEDIPPAQSGLPEQEA